MSPKIIQPACVLCRPEGLAAHKGCRQSPAVGPSKDIQKKKTDSRVQMALTQKQKEQCHENSFMALSGIVICVTEFLDRFQYLCL